MSSGERKVDAVFSEDSDDYCDVTGGERDRGDRKRKRGEIEKRRRDRINDCLNEIKELVPTAVEKSNVNKLEKAEILQMAVDHLRMVADTGSDRMSSKGLAEVQKAGFRECMGEVSRYLVAVEGMHLEEPLRLRLMSHLQATATARCAPPPPPPSHLSWGPQYTGGSITYHQPTPGGEPYSLGPPPSPNIQESKEADVVLGLQPHLQPQGVQGSPPPPYSTYPGSHLTSYYYTPLYHGRHYRPWGTHIQGLY